jgi:hypothetical protein
MRRAIDGSEINSGWHALRNEGRGFGDSPRPSRWSGRATQFKNRNPKRKRGTRKGSSLTLRVPNKLAWNKERHCQLVASGENQKSLEMSLLPLGEKVAEGRMRGIDPRKDVQLEFVPLTLTLSPKGRGDKANIPLPPGKRGQNQPKSRRSVDGAGNARHNLRSPKTLNCFDF